MIGPAPRQLVVLRAIHSHQQAKGFPITLRELCAELSIASTNGIVDHIRALERKGLVSRERYRSRTLQLTTAGRREIANG